MKSIAAEVQNQLQQGRFEFTRHAFKRAIERNSSDSEKNMTFKCAVCGSTSCHMERMSEVFQIDGRFILVEDIPAKVCSHCGEETFSREATEAIRQMLHSDTHPEKTVSMDVFAFQPLIVGESNRGRLLIVSYTEKKSLVRIISAKELTRVERDAYAEG